MRKKTFIQYKYNIIIALNTIFFGMTMHIFTVYYNEDLNGGVCANNIYSLYIYIIIYNCSGSVFRLMIVLHSYSASRRVKCVMCNVYRLNGIYTEKITYTLGVL